jgi:hypothetical protein
MSLASPDNDILVTLEKDSKDEKSFFMATEISTGSYLVGVCSLVNGGIYTGLTRGASRPRLTIETFNPENSERIGEIGQVEETDALASWVADLIALRNAAKQAA